MEADRLEPSMPRSAATAVASELWLELRLPSFVPRALTTLTMATLRYEGEPTRLTAANDWKAPRSTCASG